MLTIFYAALYYRTAISDRSRPLEILCLFCEMGTTIIAVSVIQISNVCRGHYYAKGLIKLARNESNLLDLGTDID